MWHCQAFADQGRGCVLPSVDRELEHFRAGRSFEETRVQEHFLVNVQEGLCTDTRTGKLYPCWRSPPREPLVDIVAPLVSGDEWEVTARPGVFAFRRLYAAFRPEWFSVGTGARIYAGDVNAHLDLLLPKLGKGLGRTRWRAPPIFDCARCVESGRRLGVHIPITDALADADPELVSAKNTDPAVFRFRPTDILIARKKDCEILCIKGSVSGHEVCMMLGEFRH